jgi:glycosyltransferase involved in cell wall biosynthesis
MNNIRLDTKLVSVLLASFNGAKYIREQLNSIYSQTYNNYEVIVCDDCSNDDTHAILEEYKNTHGLKYIINETRLGFVKNFENGLKYCQGDYIAFCDQDDIWYPEKIDFLVNSIGDFSVICSDAVIIDSAGNKISDSMFEHTCRIFHKKNQFKHLLFGNYVSGCTMLIKKDILKYATPFPYWVHFHDWWLALVASQFGGIFFLDKPLIYYRIHSNNQTQTGIKEKYKSFLRKIKEFREYKETGAYDYRIGWMTELQKYSFLEDESRKALNDIIAFYNDIDKSFIHFRSAYIALKYHNYMLAKRKPLGKILFIAGTLLAK